MNLYFLTLICWIQLLNYSNPFESLFASAPKASCSKFFILFIIIIYT